MCDKWVLRQSQIGSVTPRCRDNTWSTPTTKSDLLEEHLVPVDGEQVLRDVHQLVHLLHLDTQGGASVNHVLTFIPPIPRCTVTP